MAEKLTGNRERGCGGGGGDLQHRSPGRALQQQQIKLFVKTYLANTVGNQHCQEIADKKYEIS